MAEPKRNDPCPCGSGKKYKHCCLAKDQERQNIEYDSEAMAQLGIEGLSTELGGLRPAEAMVRYARPLIEMAHQEEDLQTFMNLAMVCWNLALLPPAEREQALENALHELKLDTLGLLLQRELLNMMITRHEELFPLTHRQRGTAGYALTPMEEVQRLLVWGWEYLNGEEDLDEAEGHFEKALALDAELADAYNGLAEVARLREDLDQAEAYYRTALEKARANLGSEASDAFDWGIDPETRPYLQARQNLGLLYEEMERYEDAIAEYRAFLERDPLDISGIRYLLAPVYQLKGDLAGALRTYEEFERDYPDDPGHAHHRFNWGLALWSSGHKQAAVAKLRSACFLNRYLAPVLLGEQEYPEDPEEEMGDATLDYAWDYEDLYAHLWDEAPGALEFLDRLWKDPEIQTDLQSALTLQKQMEKFDPISNPKEWEELDEQLQAIEEKELSSGLLQRVLGETTGG